jgi:hypothetical protein
MLTARQIVFAAAAAALLGAGACHSRESQADEAANAANAANERTVPKLPIPTPEPPMSREQLLVATMRAASAFAVGSDDAQLQKSLANKDYELRIRFGCGGPDEASTDGPYAWTYDAKTRTLKVRATPGLSTKDAPVKALAGEAFETVEGFWLRRPWLLVSACPKPEENVASNEKATPAEMPPSQRVGIAQFFTASDPRTMRRSGRPYEATKRLETDQVPSGGFELVLTGRLVALPDGRVIACTRSETGDQPACLISAQFGKVSIERADTHEQLAQWGSG